MTARLSLADVARAEKIAFVAAELEELVAAGVKVAVTAGELVDAEEKGLVVNLETGEAVEPVVALDRVGGNYARR